jgi:hypothetical protein
MRDDHAGNGAGSAYVYVRTGTAWSEQQKLVATSPGLDQLLGRSVDVDGDTILVGASSDDEIAGNAGSAYVFVRAGTTWSLQQKLFAPDAAGADRFGYSVAVEGNMALIGAPLDNTTGGPNAGAAYVFVRSGSSWAFVQKLTTSDGFSNDEFGERIVLQGDTAVITARLDDDACGAVPFCESGSAYVFRRLGSLWSENLKLVASDGFEEQWFAHALALDGERVMVGAFNWDNGGPAGAVYEFSTRDGESFCDVSDGALYACPCGNTGGPDTGCDLAQATGGVSIALLEQQTTPNNRATIRGFGFPPSSFPAAVIIRSDALEPGPVTFGDGLRCVGLPLVRLAATTAVVGVSDHTFGHGNAAGGGQFYYQLWFRNTPASYCTPDAFNLSNGRILTW